MLRVWDLACGGNSEIYQEPRGAPMATTPYHTQPPNGAWVSRRPGGDICLLLLAGGRGGVPLLCVWGGGGLIADHTPFASIIPPPVNCPSEETAFRDRSGIWRSIAFGCKKVIHDDIDDEDNNGDDDCDNHKGKS